MNPNPVMHRPAIKGRAGKFAGVSIPIPENGLVLGRDVAAESSLVFPENSDISRKHCTIAWIATLSDLKLRILVPPTAHCIPREERLSANQKLVCKPGQIIRLGRHNEFELVLL